MPGVENTIQPALAHYIDPKKLEELLQRMFKRKIVVYERNGVFSFTAPKLLTQDELDEVTEDTRVVR